MAESSAEPVRFDPYRNFTFRLRMDGRYVTGVSRVGGLKRTTEVIRHRDGDDVGVVRKSPGHTEYEAITLELGLPHDRDFEQWANQVADLGPDVNGPPEDFRKDLTIELYDKAGHLAIAYTVYRCWVSEYQALPSLDTDANAVAIQHLTLENEGWERAHDGTEPP